MVREILVHHSAGADKGVSADDGTADNGTVGAEGGAVFDQGRADLVHFSDFCSGVVDVGEDHGRAAEDAVFQGDAFEDRHVGLDFALFADGDIRADDHVLADVAVFSDGGVREDVGEVPDFGSWVDVDVVVDVGGFVDKKPAVGFCIRFEV